MGIIGVFVPWTASIPPSRAEFFGSAGEHEISWAPRGLASGTYVVRFTTGAGRSFQVKWSLLQ